MLLDHLLSWHSPSVWEKYMDSLISWYGHNLVALTILYVDAGGLDFVLNELTRGQPASRICMFHCM